MATMKAIRIHQFGDSSVLRLEFIEIPHPQVGEVLVRIAAASVNPVDYKIRQGEFPPVSEEKLPITLGRDFSGVVEQVGSGVGSFAKGDRVFGMVGGDASYAEYAVIKIEHLAKIPENLDFIHAAAVPLAAQTAWQALFDHGHLEAGQRVLIQGASGGVGHFAVQLAAAKGAMVYATGSDKSARFISALGADRVIDYTRERFEDVCSDIDLVVNLVSGEMQQRSWAVLRPGGILVSTLSEPARNRPDAYGKNSRFFLVEPSGAQLADIAQLIKGELVSVKVNVTFPLKSAAAAQDYLEKSHIEGKVVLTVDG
ncbi:MAG TPA: NADP-dependent oxidoreductase [Pseudomonas sp.]|jgi:NADPH:quinone reductase-like Zn-dependent oxidoreductase|uniref:NADP-dependent oxidoreductase n=1 Tax=Pseudomonas sp. TaxID=306 RepID=UPI002ED9F6C4